MSLDLLVRALELDPATLSQDARIDLLTTLAQLREQVELQEQLTLAALAIADDSPQQWVQDEVACALSIAPSTAQGRLKDARQLVELLPLTVDHLVTESITARNARVLLELAGALPDDLRDAVERRVLPRALGKTSSEFRRTVRRAIAALDTRKVEDKHRSAMEFRRVALTPCEDGMSELYARLPADGAALLMARLSTMARARRTVDPELTADQRRADALVELGGGAALAGDTGASAGPSVYVTIPFSTLIGEQDWPGELAGHGPIPASMARRIAADASGTWRRIVTDSIGRPIDSSCTYRPPAQLRALVMARDVSCRFPGCSRPARASQVADLDHIRAWADGGRTTEANLHVLCARHHHLKHETGWSVQRRADGLTVWRSPAGRVYCKEPEDSVETYLDDDVGTGSYRAAG